MFTVKHIDSDGYETVKQCLRVSKYMENVTARMPKDTLVLVEEHPIYQPCVQLWHGEEIESSDTIRHGSVYVMNDQGKTVASYHLSPIVAVGG